VVGVKFQNCVAFNLCLMKVSLLHSSHAIITQKLNNEKFAITKRKFISSKFSITPRKMQKEEKKARKHHDTKKVFPSHSENGKN
jgi:hypothetical protein